jgi:hypothetical protein
MPPELRDRQHTEKSPIPKGNAPMTQTFEDAGKFGKEFIDNGLKSLASFSRGVQAIAVETTEYAKTSFESGTAALEKLVAAKSLEKAIEVQTDYAKSSYEAFVAEATKLSDLYAELFKDSYKPFEGVVARAR